MTPRPVRGLGVHVQLPGFHPAPTAIAKAARLASANRTLRMRPLLPSVRGVNSWASSGRRLQAATLRESHLCTAGTATATTSSLASDHLLSFWTKDDCPPSIGASGNGPEHVSDAPLDRAGPGGGLSGAETLDGRPQKRQNPRPATWPRARAVRCTSCSVGGTPTCSDGHRESREAGERENDSSHGSSPSVPRTAHLGRHRAPAASSMVARVAPVYST
jgi:hypothetical protein